MLNSLEAELGMSLEDRAHRASISGGETDVFPPPYPIAERETKRGMPAPGQKTDVPVRRPCDPTLLAAIRAAHRKRIFFMEQRKRSDLALGAYLRMAMGWSKANDKDANDRIRAEVKALIAYADATVPRQDARWHPRPCPRPASYDDFADVLTASVQMREPFDRIEDTATKDLVRLAKQLPVYPWVESVRGFGALGLGIIVAEAGDLSKYSDDGKLRKRMCIAVIDGVRQGGLDKGASKAEWITHAYSRSRRSLMWNIGESLLKSNDGKYRAIYLHRKALERERAEAAGLTVLPAAAIKSAKRDDCMSLGHVHDRARRYVEQKLLRDLRRAWLRAAGGETMVPVS